MKIILILCILSLIGCSKPEFNMWLNEHMKTCTVCHGYELCPKAWDMSHPNNSDFVLK